MGQELRFTYGTPNPDAQKLRQEFDGDLERVQRYLEWTVQDVSQFNASLPALVREQVEARRQKLQRDQATLTDLGFPQREPGT